MLITTLINTASSLFAIFALSRHNYSTAKAKGSFLFKGAIENTARLRPDKRKKRRGNKEEEG